ncbi:MAG: hypothetical protein RI995_506 [Bacteroidota bacterium]|jgi:GNAT superfamily N-acetyltransferase
MNDFEIISYRSEFKSAFKALNEEWITKYFKMEESDFKALDHAEKYIIQKGGQIFIALLNQEAVGVCALIKMNNSVYDFELAKMAVSPKFQGNKIGFFLGSAAIDYAKGVGAKAIYLESNTLLAPAIQLYRKLGFNEISGYPSPYQRVDIQMSLSII